MPLIANLKGPPGDPAGTEVLAAGTLRIDSSDVGGSSPSQYASTSFVIPANTIGPGDLLRVWLSMTPLLEYSGVVYIQHDWFLVGEVFSEDLIYTTAENVGGASTFAYVRNVDGELILTVRAIIVDSGFEGLTQYFGAAIGSANQNQIVDIGLSGVPVDPQNFIPLDVTMHYIAILEKKPN
jgi:hypothetical protein